MPRNLKKRVSPSSPQGRILPPVVPALLLLVFLWSNPIVATAVEQYPWSADAAKIAGRILAISHVVNSSSQDPALAKQDTPRFRPASSELDPGPVGSSLSGTRMRDVQFTNSQMQSESMLRMQEIRSRNQEMLARNMAQMQELQFRNQQMLARNMEQRQELQFRNSQMQTEAVRRAQDMRFQNQLTLSRNMTQMQNLQFRNPQFQYGDMAGQTRVQLNQLDRDFLGRAFERNHAEALRGLGGSTASLAGHYLLYLFNFADAATTTLNAIPGPHSEVTTLAGLGFTMINRLSLERSQPVDWLDKADVLTTIGDYSLRGKSLPTFSRRDYGSFERIEDGRSVAKMNVTGWERTGSLKLDPYSKAFGIANKAISAASAGNKWRKEVPEAIALVRDDISKIQSQFSRAFGSNYSLSEHYAIKGLRTTPYSTTNLDRTIGLERIGNSQVFSSRTRSTTQYRVPAP